MGSESSTYQDEQKRFEAERLEEIRALATLENLIKETIVKVSSRPLDMPGERGEGSRGYATGIVDALNDMGAWRCECRDCVNSRVIFKLQGEIAILENDVRRNRATFKTMQGRETKVYRDIGTLIDLLASVGGKKNAAIIEKLKEIRLNL